VANQPFDTSSPDPDSERHEKNGLTLSQFQSVIHTMFYEKDESRGIEGTFMWFMEEVGELSSALRENNDPANLAEEFADVLAWLATMANVAGIDLEQAVTRKYVQGCPRCHQSVCTCDLARKP
tara:strand:- start:21381 stop:21749 length:369 start_codon:yes stop_codon:yes gene_type:complete